ncbi:hypothetical protein [Actinomadura sp. 21ATH]|uniref:hypothetical protein n=1 Tax=Actinomadura sp. 21ATH TaxID=1735444 RepID=UPI0035C0BE7F
MPHSAPAPTPVLAGVPAAWQPPTTPPPPGGLFTGPPRVFVQRPHESHQTKKRSGSSDGAMTYDTPIT